MGKRTLEAVDITESTTRALDALIAQHAATAMSAEDLRLGMETILLAQSTGIAVIQVSAIEDGFANVVDTLEEIVGAIDHGVDRLVEVLKADRIVEEIGPTSQWRIQVVGEDPTLVLLREKQKIIELRKRVDAHGKPNGDPPSEEDGA